jgi:hypothetical protein
MAVANKYYYSSQDLIDAVKRKASIPDSQSMITDDEILDFANEEMELNLLQLITRKHEDYLLVREDIPLVTNQNSYQIPYRAIGSKVREIAYTKDGLTYAEMQRISIDDVTSGFYTYGRSNNQLYAGGRYYLQNENIVIFTDPSNVRDEGFLSVFYNLRPNSLVDSSRVGIITSIDRNTGIIAMSTLPSNFTSSSEYDFIKTKSPHKIRTFDITVTNVDTANKTITVDTDDIPSELVVGDRVALAGETDVINCPSELHSMLAEMVTARVMESIGDTDNLENINKKLAKMEERVGDLLDNRVDGSPIKCKPRNGFLRRGRRTRGNRY